MTKLGAARLLAFYLPQYHPIPVNDAAWGKGFTEWTNVRRARPLFPGHLQPIQPGELGYYDLRDPGVREQQARLARDHGIEGFCYWHYWSLGHRLLERPFEEVLESGRPDLPFCLCWANQSWTGIWHGDPDRVIVEQEYGGPEDDERHFRTLLPAFRDRRYIRVEGHPLFLVFVPHLMPDARRFQSMARDAGLPGLHLIGFGGEGFQPAQIGFQGSIRHQPTGIMSLFDESYQQRFQELLVPDKRGRRPLLYRYEDVVTALKQVELEPHEHPCVLPNWDNTPRAGTRGQVFLDSTPEQFRRMLKNALSQIAGRPPERRLLFLKSWNEWAEGNYLEPDERFERAWLRVLRETNPTGIR